METASVPVRRLTLGARLYTSYFLGLRHDDVQDGRVGSVDLTDNHTTAEEMLEANEMDSLKAHGNVSGAPLEAPANTNCPQGLELWALPHTGATSRTFRPSSCKGKSPREAGFN